MTNPYASPESTSHSDLPRIDWRLRLFSWLAFVCGFVGFMARWGYTGYMDATWIFRILPTLTTLSIVSAMIALAWPWQPSERKKVAWQIFVVGIVFVGGSIILVNSFEALLPLLRLLPPWFVPQYGYAFIAALAAWIIATQLHGTIRGRRLACIGFGLAILMSSIVIVDVFIAEYAP